MAALGAGLLFTALISVLAFSLDGSGDYIVGGAVGGDNAAPGIYALLHGNLFGYLSHQPVMGLTSILLRLPFSAAGALFGMGNLTTYELGAFACLLPLPLIAAWLAGASGLTRDRRLYGLVALVVLIMSPILRTALGAGHPEGIVAGVLGTAAVIAASRGNVRAAAVLLGLAIGSQDWGVIAVPPVLIAAGPRRRRELLLIAGGLGALLTVAVWLADPPAFLRALHNEGATRFTTPLSLIWPFSIPVHLPNATVEWVRAMPLGMRRPEATLASVVAVGSIGAAAYAAVRRRVVRYDPLALLAVLGLLRCMCDSTHEEYYAIAALIPIVAWEAMQGRLAIFGALLSLRAWITFGVVGHISATELYLGSLGMKFLLVGYFARRALVLAPRPAAAAAPAPVSPLLAPPTIRAIWPPASGTLPAAAEREPVRV